MRRTPVNLDRTEKEHLKMKAVKNDRDTNCRPIRHKQDSYFGDISHRANLRPTFRNGISQIIYFRVSRSLDGVRNIKKSLALTDALLISLTSLTSLASLASGTITTNQMSYVKHKKLMIGYYNNLHLFRCFRVIIGSFSFFHIFSSGR